MRDVGLRQELDRWIDRRFGFRGGGGGGPKIEKTTRGPPTKKSARWGWGGVGKGCGGEKRGVVLAGGGGGGGRLQRKIHKECQLRNSQYGTHRITLDAPDARVQKAWSTSSYVWFIQSIIRATPHPQRGGFPKPTSSPNRAHLSARRPVLIKPSAAMHSSVR